MGYSGVRILPLASASKWVGLCSNPLAFMRGPFPPDKTPDFGFWAMKKTKATKTKAFKIKTGA
jgi:hypothetical protein